MKNIQMRYRLVGVILLVAAIVLSLSFSIIYEIFVRKLEQSDFQNTTLRFLQTEDELKNTISTATSSVNKFIIKNEQYDFYDKNYNNILQETIIVRKIIWAMDEILSSNDDLYSMAVITADGRVAGATSKNNTLHTAIEQDNSILKFLQEASDKYPYYKWDGSAALSQKIPEESPFAVLINGPVLVGVRAIGYGAANSVGYVLITIKERVVRDNYKLTVQNKSGTMMIDGDNTIISSTDPRQLGQTSPYKTEFTEDIGTFNWHDENRASHQIIYARIATLDWTLINQIPSSTYKAQKNQIKVIILCVLLITLLLLSVFFVIWILKYTKPIDRLISGMKRVAEGDLTFAQSPAVGIRELDELDGQFAITINRINTLIEQLHKMEDERHIEEIRTLQYQINPHFLYNSINSIRWLAMLNGNEKVADSLAVLVKIIMPIMRSPSFYWTVAEEIDFVDNYIKMMILRFGGAINYTVECEEQLYSEKFPRFVLQPLIENCFTHGMHTDATMDIKITITYEDGFFHGIVANSGAKIDEETLVALNNRLTNRADVSDENQSIGLPNVSKRLFLLYGEESRVWVEWGAEQHTVVRLKFKENVKKKLDTPQE